MQRFIPNPDNPFEPPRNLPFDRPVEFERPVFTDLRWGPAQVRILVLTDGVTADYDEGSGFGLGIALRDAFDPAHVDHPSYARFEITRAHRRTAAGTSPGYDNFTFTAGSLENFDEVWLFGVDSGAPYLPASEIAVLEAFMDGGGGVLAMGDHEDLGLGLCGGIKRVRSMRKWWFQTPPPPPGMVVAPDSTDLTRNDTVHAPEGSTDVNAGEQHDDVPQSIRVHYRHAATLWQPWRRVRYPHPVLCGPRGAITVMPDHQHEGDCIVPDASFASEYPGGVAVEIIANGRNVVGRTKGGYVISEPREFGLIGVWDGHKPAANAGRVLVDSTWHHWFNINLFGLRSEGGNEYRDVLAYYRNVATWLAPKAQQVRMRRAGQLVFMLTPSMFEHTLTLKRFRPERLYPLGVQARDALGRIAPQCQSAAWFRELVEPLLPLPLLERIKSKEFELERNPVELAGIDLLTRTILGGVTNALAVEINHAGLDNLESLHGKLDDVGAQGGRLGLEVAQKQLAGASDLLRKWVK